MNVYDGGYKFAPWDQTRPDEQYIRSALNYIQELKTPTFHFEGKKLWVVTDLGALMQPTGAGL
jgi:hypothetical protein